MHILVYNPFFNNQLRYLGSEFAWSAWVFVNHTRSNATGSRTVSHLYDDREGALNIRNFECCLHM